MHLCSFRLVFAASALFATVLSARAEDAPIAPPSGPNDLLEALTTGTPYWQERYRFEDVDKALYATDANAQTVRSVLGYKTNIYQNFQVDLGMLNIAQLGGHDFNDGSDGRIKFPFIGDPATTQILHANVAYTGLPQTTLIGGRQEITLDNQRWVGAASWRQIIQTFDGITVDNKSLDDVDLYYGHLFHENRSPGDNVTNGTYDMDTDLFHAAYSGVETLKLIGYSYLTNIDNRLTVPGNSHGFSTATTGARVEEKFPLNDSWKITFNGEYARQTDYGNNPNSYGLNYYLLEPGIAFNRISVKFGYEVLGSNGIEAVQSPMMASHPMNGWADQFTTTPVNGLVDSYIGLSYRFHLPYEWLDESMFESQIHHFSADQIDQHYGNEYDLDFTQKIDGHFSVGAQFEDYLADQLLVNVHKIIFTMQYDY